MESSMAAFLLRQPACERLPTCDAPEGASGTRSGGRVRRAARRWRTATANAAVERCTCAMLAVAPLAPAPHPRARGWRNHALAAATCPTPAWPAATRRPTQNAHASHSGAWLRSTDLRVASPTREPLRHPARDEKPARRLAKLSGQQRCRRRRGRKHATRPRPRLRNRCGPARRITAFTS